MEISKTAKAAKSAAKLILLIIALISPFRGFCAAHLPEPELAWKNIAVDNRKTTVFTLFKDSRGLMWLGTNRGLYFYDGVQTHAVGQTQLSGSQVYSIIEHENYLYIGGNNGLMTYDYVTGAVSPCGHETPNEIRTLLLHDNNLWIGSLNGAYLLDITTMHLEDVSHGLPHKSVYSLLRDSRGVIYAGTYNGVARWDTNSKAFKALEVSQSATGLTSVFANCMLESDDNESIYIGGEGFLSRYIPSCDSWEKITPEKSNNIKSLSKGEHGHILVGTDNGVFDLFKGNAKHYRHDSRQELSLADNEIWCIYADEQQNIWTGHERGISIASNSNALRTIKLSTLALSGEGNEIHSIYRDTKGCMWFGGTNGVISLRESTPPKWFRHTELPHSLSHNRIRAILEDAEGDVWFATDAGLNRWRAHGSDTFDTYCVADSNGEHNTNWAYAMVEEDDHFWIGSFLGGLHRVAKSKFGVPGASIISDAVLNNECFRSDGGHLNNNYVNDVVKDNDGNLWILLFRDNLLTKYNASNDKMVQYDIFELSGEYPTNICADSRGRVWCAYKGGVMVFDRSGYKNLKFPYTNSDESVLAMGKVVDGMWISTQSNMWSIDGATLTPKLLPIPQNAYTAVYEDTVSGKVYLGGADEIIEVDNTTIGGDNDYNTIKMVLATGADGTVRLHDLKECLNGVTIPYGGNLTLIVGTLNYSPARVQRYMYKLAETSRESIAGVWIVMPEGSNVITLTDLKMGNYTIMIKSVDSLATPVCIPLTVDTPMWLSWWAMLLYIISIATVIYWIVWYAKKKNMMQYKEQERQTALENVERKLTFLSTISHDLKTPLSMIMGPVSLMKERTKNPEERKTLEIVYDNAVRLNNMIHRTLELQHLEDDDNDLLILSTIDAVEFCKGVFEVFKENNPQKNFVFHASFLQLLIEADAVKFESVITNLLSNACKYSEVGATISLGISKNGNNVEIIVSDDGLGIADIDQTLVFQRMFRAPSTAKLREGTGLGLYLIKRYLELMGGNINLYSKEGQGTSFVIQLPITEKDITRGNNKAENSGENKPKILIVEDNMQISAFLSGILGEKFTCLTAENGRSGLAIAASFSPDLIIVDEMMPIMSGLEMIARLKQNPRLVAIPIIMLTAKSDNKTETDSIKLGVDAFMGKPFEPSSLLGRINQLLKARTEFKQRVRIQAITEVESKPIEAESINEKSLARIARIIEENISDPDLNVNQLCEKSGMPNKQLYRLIKKYMGQSPLDYIRSVRLQKAAVLLSQHRFTVSEISYMVGFKTPSYFAKCFQNQFGVKPSQYKSDDTN